MSSDEDDYMSEKVLSKCLPENDTKPGLVQNKFTKRKHINVGYSRHKETEQKRSKRKQCVPTKNLEASRREAGLQESIGSDNKGFALMQKMGYKPGHGIGKEQSGIAEPIGITVKTDRFGLGRATVLKEISEWKIKKRAKVLEEREKACNVDDYRKRLSEKAHEKEIIQDLNKSQKICKSLDSDKDIKDPDEKWFWPEVKLEDTEEEEILEEIEFEPPEKLKLLTSYLRECHLYCIWCGTQFQNHEDLSTSCPGPSREFH